MSALAWLVRRWRQDKVSPALHKLFHHIRYTRKTFLTLK